MKIYTNENNTSTLKLLIAARLSGKKVVLEKATLEDGIFTGPHQLPLLVTDGFTFFSSNGAVQYLFPVLDFSEGRCVQMLEWELISLQPAVSAVVNTKTVPADLKQVLNDLLITIEEILKKNQYVLGRKLTSADVSIWSSMYPLYYNEELKQKYLGEFVNIKRWIEELVEMAAFRDAVSQWNGSPTAPLATTAALGPPPLPSVGTPLGSPDEAEAHITAEEFEAAKENWLNGRLKLDQEIAYDIKLSTEAEVANMRGARDKQKKVILPIKGRKNILITSALPYVNNVPHLGNIIGCVLSADIFARYCRQCNYNTLFVCGTDEYGTATETKALQEGVTPKEICDKYFVIHKAVYDWFNISFDYFGRTSTKQQTKICQEMFLKLANNGFVSTQSVDQLHCTNCDRFLADRFVEGTCPHPGCLYEGARGDQCDKCGKLINAIELIEPRCKVCGHAPSVKASEQLFIELGQLEHSIRTWVQLTEDKWSAPARAVCRSWLREPLRARAVTRDLKWGVPVPMAGFENKVFYVWFDAPIGYMSITDIATNQHEKWWKPNKECDVKLYQFMAKDNVPFHAIMFPATMIGVNEGHLLVSHLFATEYLNYEEGKFSKSRGVGVFGTDAQETEIPPDVWRFYLASIRPETSDSSFSWTELGTRNNSELLNNLGNFCHRSLSFCGNSFKGVVPEVDPTPADYELMARVNRQVIAYVQNMEKGRLREALRHVLAVSRLGNQLMQSEKPWVLLKGSDEDKIRGASAIGLCCQLVALLCALLIPYIPATAHRLMNQLQLEPGQLTISSKNPCLLRYLPPGHVIGKSEPLFAKIEQDKLDYLRAKYSGTQAERENKLFPPRRGNATVADLYFAITYQDNLLRELVTRSTDISVIQPQIDKLNELKSILTTAYKDRVLHDNQASSVYKKVAALQKIYDQRKEAFLALQAMDCANVKSNEKRNAKRRYNKIKKMLMSAREESEVHLKALEEAVEEQEVKVSKLEASGNKAEWRLEFEKLSDMRRQLNQDQNPHRAGMTPTDEDIEDYIAGQDTIPVLKPPTPAMLIKKYLRKSKLSKGQRRELKRLQEMEEERKTQQRRAVSPTVAHVEVKLSRMLAQVHPPTSKMPDANEVITMHALMENSLEMQRESVRNGSYAYIGEAKAAIEDLRMRVKNMKSAKAPADLWIPENNVLKELRKRGSLLLRPPPAPISKRLRARMLKRDKKGSPKLPPEQFTERLYETIQKMLAINMAQEDIAEIDAAFKPLLERASKGEVDTEETLAKDIAKQAERLKLVKTSGDRSLWKPEEESLIALEQKLVYLKRAPLV